MALSEQIAQIEQENKDLREQIEALKNQPATNPAVDALLDLLEPEFAWQEEHWKDIGKWKQERLAPMLKAFRELRPRGK